MKFNLKALAIAAAMVAAGSAHADLIAANTGNGSFAMVAFNTVTNSYYVRDLGYTLNSFLPSSITTAAGDGGVTGDKTPEAGLTINWATDNTWASWLSGQTLSDIRWTVASGDSATSTGQGVSRALVALSSPVAATNNTVRVSAAGVTGLAGQDNPMGYSTSTLSTGQNVLPSFLSNNGYGAATLNTLGSAAGLYYFAATTSSGSSSTTANVAHFGNSAGFATLTLDTAGVLTYALAPAVVSEVPLPAAAWLLGSSLLGVGGMVRRRKAAAEA